MAVGDVDAADGVRLRMETRGSGDPVVALHGGLADRDQVFDQLGCLTDAWTLVGYTARGQGESSRDVHDHALERYVADMLAIVDAVSEGPVVVGGGSMGAAVALAFARRHPRRVRALVQICPSFDPDGAAPAVARVASSAARIVEAGGFAGLRSAIERTTDDERVRADTLADVDRWEKLFPPASFVARSRALSRWRPVIGLDRIDAPTLVVAWPDDDQHPLAFAEDYVTMLPNATLARVPGLANADVCAAVRGFLDDLAPA